MKRADFMAQLRAGLSGLHGADINDILADYETPFHRRRGPGRSEDEVAAALGDPAAPGARDARRGRLPPLGEHRSAGNLVGVVLALLGLATMDLIFLFPILLAMAAVFFGLACACIGVIIGGSFLLFSALVGNWHGMPP